jgi:hypothetical protein
MKQGCGFMKVGFGFTWGLDWKIKDYKTKDRKVQSGV